MKPELHSKVLLGITRSKAKLIEFSVPKEHWIETSRDPAGLFPITIGIIGDLASAMARNANSKKLLAEAKQELRFAASFFDSYQSGLPDDPKENYLTLLTAAAYYLCDLPGSAAVLTGRFNLYHF